MKTIFEFLLLQAALFSMISPNMSVAQPSGGPYGPIGQTYELPKVTGTIYYVAANGDSGQSGDLLIRPTTLEAAVAEVKTGDAIVMRGGIYRTGDLILNQGITIQPYRDERVVMKGTLVAANWQSTGSGLWYTKWTQLFPSKPADWWQKSKEGRYTPLCKFNNDMVFIDGRVLQAVEWEGAVDSNSYYIDYENGLVYIGVDPTGRLVEITAHDAALVRTTGECHGRKSDHKGYVIRGITFTQYAYRALEVEGTEPEGVLDESKFGKDVVGTTLENCTISYCSRVAGYFRGDSLTLRNCKISDTSTEGIYIIASNDVLLEGNIFMRNNIENITGYYPAAVKIFNQSHRVVCRDNLVTDLPNSNGIWYDVGEVDGVFVNNWVQNVGHVTQAVPTDQLWPSDNGFFFEISKGVVVAGNVFVNCDHGMMILNSSGARIYNNTFVNSTACIGRTGRVAAGDRFGWHATTGPGVDQRDGHVFVNNLMSGGPDFTRPLLFVWQPASLCNRLNKSQLSAIDHNVYVRMPESARYPLILWSPASNAECQSGIDSLQDLREVDPGYEANGRFFGDYDGPIFTNRELADYRVLPSFPGTKAGTRLLGDIWKLLGRSGSRGAYVGAYP